MKPGRRPNPERLSRWYSRKRPPMPGVYQVEESRLNQTYFAYWDGTEFKSRSLSRGHTYHVRKNTSCYGPWPTRWRGLYHKPAHCPAPVAAYSSDD